METCGKLYGVRSPSNCERIPFNLSYHYLSRRLSHGTPWLAFASILKCLEIIVTGKMTWVGFA